MPSNWWPREQVDPRVCEQHPIDDHPQSVDTKTKHTRMLAALIRSLIGLNPVIADKDVYWLSCQCTAFRSLLCTVYTVPIRRRVG